MASFNPLAMILNQKPLDRNNFEDWKTNLYIVLDYEKIKFVLDTPKPAIPKNLCRDKKFSCNKKIYVATGDAYLLNWLGRNKGTQRCNKLQAEEINLCRDMDL